MRLDICEYLLKNGARIDIEDKIKKQTPMQFAKSKNKRAVIDLLVEYGATPPPDHKSLKTTKAAPIPSKETKIQAPVK